MVLTACERQTHTGLIRLTCKDGLEATFTPYGARLVSLEVPGKDSEPVNVAWGFDDPAKATGSEEEIFAVFCRVRDEIGKIFGAYASGINLGTQLSR